LFRRQIRVADARIGRRNGQPVYSQWLRNPAGETTILAGLGQVGYLSLRTADGAGAHRAGSRRYQIRRSWASTSSALTGAARSGVGDLLRARVAHRHGESCTGGMATAFAALPGSAYVDRTVVAYSNEAKMELSPCRLADQSTVP
jgi:hypothetical protein